jgi:hypothetical protein
MDIEFPFVEDLAPSVCAQDRDAAESSEENDDDDENDAVATSRDNPRHQPPAHNPADLDHIAALELQLQQLQEKIAKKDVLLARLQTTVPALQERASVRIEYHNLSAPMRKAVDTWMQHSELERNTGPPNEAACAAMGGAVQYFETFCIDTAGVRVRPEMMHSTDLFDVLTMPLYDAPLNLVPLPLQVSYATQPTREGSAGAGTKRPKRPDTDAGLLKAAVSVCFNCGDNTHSLHSCLHAVNSRLVGENSAIFREASGSGPSAAKKFKPRYVERSVPHMPY